MCEIPCACVGILDYIYSVVSNSVQDMCGSQGESHLRARASHGHNLRPVRDQPRAPTASLCVAHNQVYRFYDTVCACLVCQDCLALQHSGHKCVTMAAAAKSARKKLDASAAEMERRCRVATEALSQIRAAQATLSHDTAAANTALQAAFNEVLTRLSLRTKDVESMAQVVSNKPSTITTCTISFTNDHVTATACGGVSAHGGTE